MRAVRRLRGMTLIETIVTLLVVGILAGVALVTYRATQTGGEDLSELAYLRSVAAAVSADAANSGNQFVLQEVVQSVQVASVNVDPALVPSSFVGANVEVTAPGVWGLAFGNGQEPATADDAGQHLVIVAVTQSGKGMRATVPWPDRYATTLPQPSTCLGQTAPPFTAAGVGQDPNFCQPAEGQ